MNTRRTAVKTLALLAVLAAFPLTQAYAADAKPKVALVMKSLANEFFQTMEEGANKNGELKDSSPDEDKTPSGKP